MLIVVAVWFGNKHHRTGIESSGAGSDYSIIVGSDDSGVGGRTTVPPLPPLSKTQSLPSSQRC